MSHSVGNEVVGTGGFVESPYFEYKFGPSWKFINFEVQIEGMSPYKHFAILR